MPGAVASAVASLVVPGLGQILNGKYLRGGVLVIGWIVTSAIVMAAAFFLLILTHLLFMVLTAFDAYRIAKAGVQVT